MERGVRVGVGRSEDRGGGKGSHEKGKGVLNI